MKSSNSSLFLMELLISILFFSLASAVCIQLFVKAHLLDIKTEEKSQAVIWMQNLAELWQASSGNLNIVGSHLSADLSEEEKCALSYSEDGKSLSLSFDGGFTLTDSDAVYLFTLTDYGYDVSEGLLSAEVFLFKGKTLLYRIPLLYHPAMGKEADA